MVVALVLAVASAGPVTAGEVAHDAKTDAKARFVAGQSHYNLNEFAEALQEFKEGYRLFPDPVFLYNLGQCERQLGHYDEAIRFYRSFLREQPKAPNKQEVLKKIEEMEAAQRNKAPENDKVAPPALPLGVPEPAKPVPAVPDIKATAPAAPVAEPQPAPASEHTALPTVSPVAPLPSAAPASPTDTTPRIDLGTTAPPPAAASAPIYSRWWFWTAAVVVVAGAGAGIYAATAKHSADVPSSGLGAKGVF